MAEKKYLDANGVKTLWDKVVQKIPTKTSDLTNDSGFLNVTLADVATSGSYADLSNKPTIPTVNNATLTVQQNGKSVGTFTANASENKTINITVPTKISDLTNDLNLSSYATESYVDTKVSNLVNSAPETLDTLNELASALGNDPNFATTISNQIGNKANTSDLSAVATSGSYNDLSDKPTIPTVNNATLTIQKNGTTVKTFTANASANVTANITVPTKVSDLTNDSGFLTTHQDISGKADKSTTLSGYGITDAYTKSQVDDKIPTVNNATLTIQKNGTTVKTFTANASSNVTCNITVPTKISDLTNDGGFVSDLSSYYSKSETDTLLSGKSDTDHTHSNYLTGITKSMVTTALGYTPPTSDTNTHYTTTLYAGAKDAKSNAVTTNGNTYLKLYDDNTVRAQLNIKGSGATTVTTDANGVITINSTDNNTTYSVATTSKNGLMSSTDKTKLDGLSNYTLPTASSELGGVKTTSTVTSTSGLTACPIISGVPYYKDTNTTYSAMSAAEATTGTATTARSITAKVLHDKISAMLPTKVSQLTNDSKYVTQTDAETWQTNRLKPGSVVFTINPSDWQNGACVKNVGVDAKYYCSLGVPVSANTANLANVSNANVIITEHSGSNMTFKCLGSVPTSAITLELTVFYYDVIDKSADYFNITDAEIDAIFG